VPEIRLERKLSVPADNAAQALGDVLKAIADQQGPWRGFALHVSFGDLHLPDVGYVAVPISLSVEKDPSDARTLDIAFTSANLPAVFPGFKGHIGVVDPGALGESKLFIAGTYELPMQIFGKFLGAAFTPGVAERSLENFLGEIGAACEALVNKREAEFARYRFYSQR
jgi:hypothetical protein